MIDWLKLKQDYDDLLSKLSSEHLDQKTRSEIQKKISDYGKLLEAKEGIDEKQALLVSLTKEKELCEQEELALLYQEEIDQIKKEEALCTQRLYDLLYPPCPEDEKSVFLEIRSGAGGDEAALFAADLFSMYNGFAQAEGWQVSIMEAQSTGIGGYKEIVLHIKGKGVYRKLKFESGVHRVQRVPATESAGRVHTSTVTVAVLPEVDEVQVQINPQDIRIDTYRSSGAGGQHVNTTDSAIRITHLPTGIVVTCQDERSQTKNKEKALKNLKARIFEAEKEKKESAISKQRKEQVGSGDRSEKIRTYNYPQNRVTDHRVGLTLKKLDMVIAGDLEEIIQALRDAELAEKQKQAAL